jgi:sialic acid synthase SpsE
MFAERTSTYVIAEIGSNWAANVDAAKSLIWAAKQAGADAVKFQAGHADHVYDPVQFPEEHAAFKKWVEPTTYLLSQLAGYAYEANIDFGCSAFCLDALDVVDQYVKWHKVASIEATWAPFVKAVLGKGKPTIISAGMIEDGGRQLGFGNVFRNGYGWYTGQPKRDVVLLGCSVKYPSGLDDANLMHLLDIEYYANQYGLAGFGYSDHTSDPTTVPSGAVSLGATVIEKHLRGYSDITPYHRQDMTTPDVPHSIDPQQFREMVDAIRSTEQALGSPKKRNIAVEENPHRRYDRGPRGLRGA